jgi:hypothetical protein
MKIISRITRVSSKIGLAWSSFALRYPRGYLITTALVRMISLFSVHRRRAQLETQVTEAAEPVKRGFLQPGCWDFIIGLFAFVFCTQAGG